MDHRHAAAGFAVQQLIKSSLVDELFAESVPDHLSHEQDGSHNFRGSTAVKISIRSHHTWQSDYSRFDDVAC